MPKRKRNNVVEVLASGSSREECGMCWGYEDDGDRELQEERFVEII
jgi:hypothetical protein